MLLAYAEWNKIIRIETNGDIETLQRKVWDWFSKNPNKKDGKFIAVDVFSRDNSVIGYIYHNRYEDAKSGNITNKGLRLSSNTNILAQFWEGGWYEIPWDYAVAEDISEAIIKLIGSKDKWVLSVKDNKYILYTVASINPINKDFKNKLWLDYIEYYAILVSDGGSIRTEFSFKEYSEYGSIRANIDILMKRFYNPKYFANKRTIALIADDKNKQFKFVEVVTNIEYIE